MFFRVCGHSRAVGLSSASVEQYFNRLLSCRERTEFVSALNGSLPSPNSLDGYDKAKFPTLRASMRLDPAFCLSSATVWATFRATWHSPTTASTSPQPDPVFHKPLRRRSEVIAILVMTMSMQMILPIIEEDISPYLAANSYTYIFVPEFSAIYM